MLIISFFGDGAVNAANRFVACADWEGFGGDGGAGRDVFGGDDVLEKEKEVEVGIVWGFIVGNVDPWPIVVEDFETEVIDLWSKTKGWEVEDVKIGFVAEVVVVVVVVVFGLETFEVEGKVDLSPSFGKETSDFEVETSLNENREEFPIPNADPLELSKENDGFSTRRFSIESIMLL